MNLTTVLYIPLGMYCTCLLYFVLEYQDLNNTMDQIDKWMTDIESQNDSLVSKLKDLLEENRQIRAEIQMENSMASHSLTEQDEDLEKPGS